MSRSSTRRRIYWIGWSLFIAGVALLLSGMSAWAQFTEINAGFTQVSSGRALWGDYDNDGDLDVLISGFISGYNTGNTVLYRNDGGGVFTPVTSPFQQVGYSAGAWGDYDADGNLDVVLSGLVTGSGTGYSYLYHNNGNGTFTTITSLPSSPYGSGIYFGSECWGDFDKDGDQDLLQGGGSALAVFRNDNGGLTNAGIAFSAPFSGDSYGHGVWADFDNDGDLDIVAAASTSYPPRCRIFRNDGTNVFTVMQEIPNRYFNSAAWGDYDNDGLLDLAIMGADNVQGPFAEVYRNDGGTNFTLAPISLPGGGYSSIAWGDYNNDGRLDLLLGGAGTSNNVTRLYRNDGGNVFTLVWTAPQELSDAVTSWGDYDNDGDLDFIICGLTNGVKVTKLFRNDSAVSNTPPTSPGNLTVVKQGRTATLSWSAATDAQQPAGLSYNGRLGTAPGGFNRIVPNANPLNGFRRVPELGNAGLRTNYTITNLSAGTYYWSVQAIDHAYAGSAFAAEVSFTISPPTITNQPQGQTISAGNTAMFTVGASGAEPLAYQWRFNSVNLPGATNASLALSNAQFVNQGNYSVAVTDVVGTSLSSNAFLTVNSAPVIIGQPTGNTVGVGGGVNFSVNAIGNAPLAYQWRFNRTNLDGATNASLLLLNVQTTNAGIYSVLVTNLLGSTLSLDAQLNLYQAGQGVQTASAPGAVDMVYDSARDLIYITSGSSILRYHVGSNLFLTPFVLGTGLNLWQLDLSYDGKTLVAANYSGGTSIYVVDLPNNTNREVVLPASGLGDNGTYSVAFGNDNAALITGDYPGSGWVSLRRYDAVAGTNSSIASVFMRSLVTASGNGNVIGIIEGSISSGNLHRYSVAAKAITNTIGNGWFCWIAPGVNKDGSQFAYATDGGTFIYNTNMAQIGTIGEYFSYRPVGVVYHPTDNLVFFVWGGSTQVRVYDTTTLTETNRYEFGTYFSADTGTTAKTSYRTRISRDGSLLMVNVGNAIKYLRWTVSPPQIVSQPTSTSTVLTSNASFSVTAIGNGPFSYQWQFNGANLIGATSSTLTLTNVQYAQAGGYSALVFNASGFATSSVASLTVNGPPLITNQPQSQVVFAGTNVSFFVSANGTQPFSYQWLFNDGNLVGTGSQLDLANVQAANAGNYFVVLNNGYGNATSTVAVLAVNPIAPLISQPPQSQTVGAGTDVTLSVTAIGTEPLGYQWFFGGGILAGKTSATLVISNVQPANFGGYSVVVSNSVGTNLSAEASLTVTSAPPTFIVIPSNVTATRGAEVTFTGLARGSDPISYLWQFGTNDIPGATTTTLLLTNVQSTNVGSYRLIATNDYGTNFGSAASLAVTPSPGFLWARKGGGTSSDVGNVVAVDSAGNAYVAGYFNGTATFANTNVTSAGGNDVFVAKYDTAGQLLWLRQAGGTGSDIVNALAVDATGNVFVTGYYLSSIASFGGVLLTNVGPGDCFIAKYDPSGGLVWARSYGGAAQDQGNGIGVDAAGNIFVTGLFTSAINFGATNLTTSGNTDVFIAKFDSNGNALWAKRAGGTSADAGQALALDAEGNVFVTGAFLSAAFTFDGVTLSNTLAGYNNLFVAKLTGDGNLLWARKAGGTLAGGIRPAAIATDPAGNVFVTGNYGGNATFDSVTIASVSSTLDVFLARYNSAGAITWAKSAGGTSSDYGNGVTTDAGGNAYVVGSFFSSATFGTTNQSSAGGDDAFVSAYSAAGNVLWIRKAGGPTTDFALGVTADGLGNILLTGQFSSPSSAFGHMTLSAAGSLDAFLAKFAAVDPLAPPAFTLQPSSQNAPAGANVTLSSGFVGAPPVTFQWLLNGTNLLGATNAALTLSNATPTLAGSYAVILNNPNGAVTSAVATVTVSIEPDFLWALGSGGVTNDEILGVVCDTNGNSYVAGYFSGTFSLAGTNLISAGGEDVFVAKFDSTTNLVWAQRAGGSGDDRATGLAFDGTDRLIVVGSFSGTADFSGVNLVGSGGSDAFVAGYDSGNGNRIWAQHGGGSGDDTALGVALAAGGQVFVTGFFQGNATIAGSGLNSAGTNDMFLAKFSLNGASLGARSAGGSGDDRGRSVTCDGAGNVFVAGAFSGTASFSGTNLVSNAAYDAFVVKYDSAMNRIWARKAGTAIPPAGGGAYNDEATAIAATPDNGFFVAGYFNNRATFGTFTNTTAGTNLPDTFLAKCDGNGNVLWVNQAGGTNSETAAALATDAGGNACVAGWFNGPAQFGPASITNVGGADVFVAMYDATGRLLKVRRAGGVGADAAQAVALDGRGNAVIGGAHGAPAAFGGFAVDSLGGRDAFAAKVSFFTPDLPPVITSQPVGAGTTNGLSVSLAVGVSSSTPLQFQWFFNGSALAGATNGTLNLPNVQFAHVGTYIVTVANSFGSVTSAPATVRIDLPPVVLWTAKHGGTGDDQGLAVAVDATTNVYVAGYFSGTVAFGSSNFVSLGGTDIYFAKYNSAGGLLWVRRYGGGQADTVAKLVLDSAGNIFMAGGFYGTAFIGGTNLVSAGAEDCFLCKHDSAGNFLWAQRGGGNMTLGDRASSVATDSAGNAYLTGSYAGGATFGSISLTNQNSNWTNFFLVKYDPNGNALWGRAAVGTNTHGNGVTVDAATNVYVTGLIGGSANFGSGLIVNTNNSPAGGFGNATVFVAKYDANGALQWAKKGGTNGLGYGQNIITDAAGNVFATSYRRDYGGGVMLTKYDSGGNVLWVRTNYVSCCTSDYISVNGLALDAGGNPVLAGGITGSTLLEGLNLFSPQQGFIVKYRGSDGAPVWIFKSGQMGYAAALDSWGNAYVAGRFSGTTLFGTSSNLVSSGGNDAFLVKFGIPTPAITTQPADQFVIAGSNSTVQVTTAGAPATYQWLLNGTNVPGATSSSLGLSGFNLLQSGRYSVVVQSASGWTTSSVAGVSLIPVLSVARADDAVVLNWDGAFTLQSAASVLGPYADLISGVGPVTNPVTTDELARYFRLRLPNPDVTGALVADNFALGLTGSPGRRYTIQTSTNLLDWTPLVTDVFPFTLQESSVTAQPQKFYRALLAP